MENLLYIEFIRPITIDGFCGRYHNYTNCDFNVIENRLFELKTDNFVFRCPLGLIHHLHFHTNNERIFNF